MFRRAPVFTAIKALSEIKNASATDNQLPSTCSEFFQRLKKCEQSTQIAGQPKNCEKLFREYLACKMKS